jgi:hypothetical protein
MLAEAHQIDAVDLQTIGWDDFKRFHENRHNCVRMRTTDNMSANYDAVR